MQDDDTTYINDCASTEEAEFHTSVPTLTSTNWQDFFLRLIINFVPSDRWISENTARNLENKSLSTIWEEVLDSEGNVMNCEMVSWHSLDVLTIVEESMDRCKYVLIFADYVHPYMQIVPFGHKGIF